MMNNLKWALLPVVGPYLAGSFAMWDFNAGNWPDGVRGVITVFAALAFLTAASYPRSSK